MKRSRKTLVITLVSTFILMALLVIYTARVIFRTAFSSVQELGDDKTSAITADLENYLETAKSVLWVAADSVDHMVSNGAGYDEIVEYITRESSGTEAQFDESYTGIYGLINGEYVDGVGWVPPDDYVPQERDWYRTSVAAEGKVILVPPYVDAQTGSVIISIGKSLTNPNDALALDLTLNGVQEIVENIQINGYGYGFILNNDGMIISHPDKSLIGTYYNEGTAGQKLFDRIVRTGKGNFDAKVDGSSCTVFVDTVMDQWHLVVVTKKTELYKEPLRLLYVSILINLIVFIFISTFYILSYRYQARFNARMEEMNAIEQKREYEAKILKLEKSAADSANRAKSNFLADMSHEIRTPINAILGMNDMILHESEDPDITDYASNIKSAGNTLLSIINTILDFSKIEDGRMHLVPAPFRTEEVLGGLYNSIHERAKAKNLELSFVIDPRVPAELIGDDVRISQVVMNLLTNAVKYTEKGSVTFTVSELEKNGTNEWLLFSVKDTGIGIREEDISKLSISFERIDETKNRHIEGTGLGISIVTRLLEMMDSELKVHSEYGVGSEFFFELRLERASDEVLGEFDASRRSKPAQNGMEISIEAPTARILVTDDNEMNLKVVKNLLKLFSIRPELAVSGRETIRKTEKAHYDILLLDHMMPDMDGIETLKKLKEKNLVEDTVVIALTANAVVGAKEQYLAAGFDDYLSKPINLPELEDTLKKYLPAEMIHMKTQPSDSAVTKPEKAGAAPAKTESAKTESVKTEATEQTVLEKLEGIGISTEDGLNYCGGDEKFYREILHDYASAAPEKAASLCSFLEAGSLKDYKTLVHSVKSSSKTIGAMDLFQRAKDMEAAAAEEDTSILQKNHAALMEDYLRTAETIEEILA